jgi:DNA-binding CsgD family transcriptional regulator
MADRRVPVLSVLDATYRVDQASDGWLRGVIAAASPALDNGLGVAGYFVDMRNGGFRTSGYQGIGEIGSAAGRAVFATWKQRVPVELKRYAMLHVRSGSMYSAMCGLRKREDAPDNVDLLDTVDRFPDLSGINAIDTELLGCSLVAPLRIRKLRPRFPLWSRLAAHLCAGVRLQRRLATRSARLIEGAEAVVEPGGRVVHADGAARDRIARAVLRDAALQIDYARTHQGRLSDEELVQAWRALYLGRWSMLDSFDHDGRRYFIAWPNQPYPRRESLLSARELQVARAAALGHSNKLIAYELGLSTSTVATLLARAGRKLRLGSRAGLIRRFANDLGL